LTKELLTADRSRQEGLVQWHSLNKHLEYPLEQFGRQVKQKHHGARRLAQAVSYVWNMIFCLAGWHSLMLSTVSEGQQLGSATATVVKELGWVGASTHTEARLLKHSRL
jgi:hypothetical protein